VGSKIHIDADKCDGCGDCLEACDNLPYGQAPCCDKKVCGREGCVDPECAKIKEFAVLKIRAGKVTVANPKNCNGCGECMYVCRHSAIIIDESDFQSMGPIMQDLQPQKFCEYCDVFDKCQSCAGGDCLNCTVYLNCTIKIQSLAGPWFTSSGEEIG